MAQDRVMLKVDPSDPQYVEKLVALCKWSELNENYEEMCEYLKLLVVAKNGSLTENERKLFTFGFKRFVGNLRRSWRRLPENEDKRSLQRWIDSICDSVLSLINLRILPKEKSRRCENDAQAKSSIEALTWYHKMIGDYERYKAELRPGESSKKALQAYKKATKIAKPLPDTNTTKLGLALNYSVYLYHIKNRTEEAVDIAIDAFDNASKDLGTLNENELKDTSVMMQLIQDNLTLWTSGGEILPEEDSISFSC